MKFKEWEWEETWGEAYPEKRQQAEELRKLKKGLVEQMKKFNTVWIGEHTVGALSHQQTERIMGFDEGHCRVSGLVLWRLKTTLSHWLGEFTCCWLAHKPLLVGLKHESLSAALCSLVVWYTIVL